MAEAATLVSALLFIGAVLTALRAGLEAYDGDRAVTLLKFIVAAGLAAAGAAVYSIYVARR